MSNNRSLSERLNNIKDERSDKWLSRGLFEGPAEDKARKDSQSLGGSQIPRNPGAPPRGYQKGHPQFKQYDSALSAYAAYKTQNPDVSSSPSPAADVGSSQRARMTNSPAGRAETDREQRLPAEADRVIADIQRPAAAPPAGGGQPPRPPAGGGGGSQPPRPPGGGNYDHGDFDQVLQRVQQFIERHGKTANGRGLLQPARQLLDTLNGPNRNRILDYLGYSQEWDRKIQRDWDDLSDIRDEGDARQFLTEGFGYQIDPQSGLYTRAPYQPGEHERHSLPINNDNKGYRGLQHGSLKALLNPDIANRLTNMSRQDIQRTSIRNPQLASSAYQLAELFLPQFDPELRGRWNKVGGADAMREALNPNIPVEWLTDASGMPTGLTNIDQLAYTDPEAYQSQFRTTSQDPRGTFELAKAFMLGGRGQMLLNPDFLDETKGVVDHLEGRTQERQDERVKKDAPLNQGWEANDFNWAKADSTNAAGGHDTPEGLVRRAENYRDGSILGLGNFDRQNFNPDNEQDMESLWLANRLKGADLNRTEQQAAAIPNHHQQFLDMDSDTIKELVDLKNLNIRNLGMYYPRFQHGPYGQNTWSGAMNRRGGYNRAYYDKLDDWRRPFIANAYGGPNIQNMLTQRRQELEAEGLDPEKVEEEAQSFFKKLIKLKQGMPIQSAAASWTTGLVGKDDYLGKMGELAQGQIDQLNATDEELGRYGDGVTRSLANYSRDITNFGYNNIPRVTDDWMHTNIGSNPMVNLGFSNYGRQLLPQGVLDHFDEEVQGGGIQTPFGKGRIGTKAGRSRPQLRGQAMFDFPTRRFAESSLELTANTVL